ncbi:MAG: prephenate dehydratase [Deltaproteobacteria bacterium]|nr:prephenate dehydratase [Deltaproteobacteria bacterium]
MKRKIMENIRKEIRKKDGQIVRLLNERASLSLEVGQLKNLLGVEVYDPSQESRVLGYLADVNKGPLPEEALGNIYREILSSSRRIQAPLSVACLGPESSFTHLAALSHFGRSARVIPKKTIEQVFDEMEKGGASFGVVPLENSVEGSVKLTLDRLIDTSLKIRAEIFLRISHCLLSPGAKGNVRTVYSHPQALAQCRTWLAKNLPRAELVETESTASAAIRAREDQRGAAVGSRISSETYGLRILAEGIEDHPTNTTRFIVLGKGQSEPTGEDKTSILFGTPHIPGALHAVLGPFSRAGINLLRIESHPIRNRMWEYLFFVDFAGHAAEKKVRNCLRRLEKKAVFLKVLGSYPKGNESR